MIDLSSHPAHFHRLDFKTPDPTNENSCFVSYYQYGRAAAIDDDSSQGKTALLNQLAVQFLSEPTFDQLRTKEQLGYVVFSQRRIIRDI